MIDISKDPEPIELSTNLIKISEDTYIPIDSITGITLIYHHPDNENNTSGYPKYQVFCNNQKCHWSWCIITIKEFNKYLKPFILNIE